MRTSLISLCLAGLAVMAFAASPDDKPKPSDGDQASAATRRGWPEADKMVAGRLAIQDHGMQQRAHVLSVIVELKNRSGHALEMEFDPHDLHIEMFNSDGGRIEEAGHVRSGPVPMSHRMTISADAYAGLPTHRGGVGLPVGKTMLAAGWQVWILPPGKYTMKGTAKITAGFGSAVLDPLLPSRNFRAKKMTSHQSAKRNRSPSSFKPRASRSMRSETTAPLVNLVCLFRHPRLEPMETIPCQPHRMKHKQDHRDSYSSWLR